MACPRGPLERIVSCGRRKQNGLFLSAGSAQPESTTKAKARATRHYSAGWLAKPRREMSRRPQKSAEVVSKTPAMMG